MYVCMCVLLPFQLLLSCSATNFNPIQNVCVWAGGGGGVDATQDLNPLLLTNDCVYSVPTS